MKLQFVVAMSFGMTKGAVEHGGVVWNATGGLEALRQAGANLATSVSNVNGDTAILDQSSRSPWGRGSKPNSGWES
jgi:hypothetical protein